MEKIRNIESLRFFLILAVVTCHLKPILKVFPVYENILNNAQWAWLSVDCFFMIAGFFLFLKTDFTQKFSDFAKKKLIRFMPLVVFTLFLYLIGSLSQNMTFSRYENIFTLLNIQNVGLTFCNGDVGTTWFISALFWSMCFYFYLYKILEDKRWFNLITACTIFFCYAFFVHSPAKHFENVAFVFNIGSMRAFAGIGVGYFLSMIYKDNIDKIRNAVLNIWQKLLITGFEVYAFCFTFYYLCFHRISYNNKMIMIITFIGLLGLFLAKKGFLTRFLDNKFSVFLGQFTFSIFVTHAFVIKLWSICAHKNVFIVNPTITFLLVYVSIVLFGVLTYYLVEKPTSKYFKNKFLKY